MDLTIAGVLTLDGLTNGAIYALLGIATVLIFTVTRILFIPQGEFVAFGALTLALFQTGQVPGTVWLLLVASAAAFLLDLRILLRTPAASGRARAVLRLALGQLALPAAIAAVSVWAAPRDLPILLQGLLTLLIVTPLGPLTYRLAYQSIAEASVLVLLIVSVGVHFVLLGLALFFFGAEGFRNPPFIDARYALGPLNLSGQVIAIFAAFVLLMALLKLFFGRTLYGKALRATAVNRLGARLLAISADAAGKLAFAMAAFIGALSGLLIGSTTTVFYDSGFLIGLKGFIAAVGGGLASYPATAVGALLLGVAESFGSFWASSLKEAIVFTLILPVLLWRSLYTPHHEEH